ncbi:MAG: hypothetical protein COV48_16225, partial [Elusimicrobia bacterium CG11_big_fil_rev_8_21_14_0_20_64_6]
MINQILVLSLLAVPLHARPSEALRLSADNLSASFKALSDLTNQPRVPAKPPIVRRRRFVPRRDVLPENCANLPVVSTRNGEIFKNGVRLGRNSSSYQSNCDGLVMWTNSYGELYRETERVASRVSSYDLAWFGDSYAW